MKKTVIDIIRDVRTCMDEIALNDSDFIGGSDSEDMHEIIRQKIKEAVDYIHGNAMIHMLDLTDENVKSIKLDEDSPATTGCIDNADHYVFKRPADYLRFIHGTMNCWKEYVTELTYSDEPDYARVFDTYAGASVDRPAIAWDGKEFTFVKGGAATDEATLTYLPYCDYNPNSDAFDTEIAINRPLYPALIYHISGLVLMTYGEQRADDMFNQSLTHMGINGAKE